MMDGCVARGQLDDAVTGGLPFHYEKLSIGILYGVGEGLDIVVAIRQEASHLYLSISSYFAESEDMT